MKFHRRAGTVALAVALVATLAVAAPASAAAPPAQATCVTDPATPKRQFRALWIASVQRLDWPSGTAVEAQQAEYRDLLDYAVAQRMNAVVVQVRPTADAFWPSPYEPWSGYLTGVRGQDPGWDPLAFLVAEAHQRNLEFHAWFNPYRASMPASSAASTEAGGDIGKLAAGHPLQQHPDWAVVYPTGIPTQTRLYYNPGIPAARKLVEDAIMDAVSRYDIDGVHFDDYFYPYPVAGQVFDDAATFAQYGGGFSNLADWRRNNIDLLIQELGAQIKAIKPWVKFGISPFAVWRNKATDPEGTDTTAGVQTYDDLAADTRKWVREEWIDYIVPQVYWAGGFAPADYNKIVPWWADQVRGTHVHLYIGEATYKVGTSTQSPDWSDPQELSDHLAFDSAIPEVKGNIYFSAKDVRGRPPRRDHAAQQHLVHASGAHPGDAGSGLPCAAAGARGPRDADGRRRTGGVAADVERHHVVRDLPA